MIKPSITVMLSVGSSIVAASLFTGCKPDNSEAENRLNQLTRNNFECLSAPEARISELFNNIPPDFLRRFEPSEERRVKELLGMLPDAYVQHLVESNSRSGFHISKQSLGPGVGGVTQLGYYPAWAKVSPGNIDFALIHEIGHALDFYVQKSSKAEEHENQSLFNSNNSDFESRLRNLMRTEGRSSEVRSYARSGPREYFAESFQNFYCSPESQAFIKNKLPETFSFLRTNLERPHWESNSPGTDANENERLIFKLVRADPFPDQYWVVASTAAAAAKISVCLSQDENQCNPTLPYSSSRFENLSGIGNQAIPGGVVVSRTVLDFSKATTKAFLHIGQKVQGTGFESRQVVVFSRI